MKSRVSAGSFMRAQYLALVVLSLVSFSTVSGCASLKNLFSSESKKAVRHAEGEVAYSTASAADGHSDDRSSVSSQSAPSQEESSDSSKPRKSPWLREQPTDTGDSVFTDADDEFLNTFFEEITVPRNWPFYRSATEIPRKEYNIDEWVVTDLSEVNGALWAKDVEKYNQAVAFRDKFQDNKKATSHLRWSDIDQAIGAFEHAPDQIKRFLEPLRMWGLIYEVRKHEESGKDVLVKRDNGALQGRSGSNIEQQRILLKNISVFLPKDDPDLKETADMVERFYLAGIESQKLLDVYHPKKLKVKEASFITKKITAKLKKEQPKAKVIDVSVEIDWRRFEGWETPLVKRYTDRVDGIALVKEGGVYTRYDFFIYHQTLSNGKKKPDTIEVLLPTVIEKDKVDKKYRK